MKSIKVLLFLSVWFGKIYAQDFKEDSIYLSKQLQPFREYLDSALPELEWQQLINLYKNKIAIGDTVLIVSKPINDTLTWLNYTAYETAAIDKITTNPPKYLVKNIPKLDSNNILFYEVEVDLPNRKELMFLKDVYFKATSNLKKIEALLRFINALNNSFPKNQTFKFSLSNSFGKYAREINKLFHEVPNNFDKATWLINYAKTLDYIDRENLSFNIYSIYIETETILLAPYFIEKSRIPVGKITGKEYEKYVLTHNIGTQLINIYVGIVNALTLQNTFNENNLLYPILRKRSEYKMLLIQILTIVSKYDLKKEEDLIFWEESIMDDFTSKPFTAQTLYNSDIIEERQYLINQYLNKLIVKSSTAITERRKSILYYSLASLFYKNKEERYAFKAYFKALESAFNSNTFTWEWHEMIYYALSEKFSNKFFEQTLDSVDIKDYFKIVELYQFTNNSARPEKYSHTPIYSTLSIINYSRWLNITGNDYKAKQYLILDKRAILQDSANLNKNAMDLIVLYKELLSNNWLELDSSNSRIEFYFDSIMLGSRNSGEVFSYNNPNIAQEFYRLSKVVDDSRWNFSLSKSNDSIKLKTSTIVRLSGELKFLNAEIQNANKALDKRKFQMDSINTELGAVQLKLEENIRTNTQLAGDNKALLADKGKLMDDKNSLSKTRQYLFYGIGFLAFLSLILIRVIIKSIQRLSRLKAEAKRIEKENEENNYKLKLEKRIEEGKLLSHLAEEHDIDKFIGKLPDMVEWYHYENKEELIDSVKNFSDYYKSNSFNRGLFKTTIESEMNISQKAAEVYTSLSARKVPFTIGVIFMQIKPFRTLKSPKD